MAFNPGEKIRQIKISGSVKVNYKKGGYAFEILAKQDTIEKIRASKTDKDLSNLSLDQILAVDEIYFNADAGNIAGGDVLKKVFGSDDKRAIAIKMIKDGNIDITVEQRRKMIEKKLSQLITTIHQNAIDPFTKTPVPVERIKLALEQVKFKADLYQPLEKQVQEAVKKIQPILPISFEQIKLRVVVPSEYAPRSYGFLKKYQPQKLEYSNDGSLESIIKLPASQKVDFLSQINNLTKGTANITEIQ